MSGQQEGSAYTYARSVSDYARRLHALPLADMSKEARRAVISEIAPAISVLLEVIKTADPRAVTDIE